MTTQKTVLYVFLHK